MKLILTREVAGLGRAGDVVNVKDGYARNFLIPRGNAIAWSEGGEKQIDGIRRARQSREIRDKDHANEIKAKLEATTFEIKVKVGSTGRLFGSVTEKDIPGSAKRRSWPTSFCSMSKTLRFWPSKPKTTQSTDTFGLIIG